MISLLKVYYRKLAGKAKALDAHRLNELRARLPGLVETKEWNEKKAAIMQRRGYIDGADYCRSIASSAAKSIELIEKELSK